MRINKVTYGKLKTPLKVNGNESSSEFVYIHNYYYYYYCCCCCYCCCFCCLSYSLLVAAVRDRICILKIFKCDDLCCFTDGCLRFPVHGCDVDYKTKEGRQVPCSETGKQKCILYLVSLLLSS